jgi:hypothetical protein
MIPANMPPINGNTMNDINLLIVSVVTKSASGMTKKTKQVKIQERNN